MARHCNCKLNCSQSVWHCRSWHITVTVNRTVASQFGTADHGTSL